VQNAVNHAIYSLWIGIDNYVVGVAGLFHDPGIEEMVLTKIL